ncbi:MAG: hypothetical protein AABW75_04145 [Nanoarchaeota archaeon]
MGDTINISGKTFVIVLIILLLLSGTLAGFFLGYFKSDQDSSSNLQLQYQNISEKCRLPAGQDLNAWKEHLGHHAEIQDCLKYFK